MMITNGKSLVICVFLIVSSLCLSGYKFRCWILCTDQTATQNDYVSARDKCRQYAQLRIDTDTANPQLIDDKAKKGKMVQLFSACMADEGWTVPNGVNPTQQAAAPTPIPTPAVASGALPAAAAAKPAAATAPVAAVAAPAAAAASGTTAATLSSQQREHAFLARESECAFARHAAGNSSIAATRARACDLECGQRLKAAPGAPRPAACPADPDTVGK